MFKANSRCGKSLSVLLAVLMLVTCIPVISAPMALAADSGEVFGYVTLGPIIYTHGTKSYSHPDWPDDGRYDYMMNGSIIADGSFDGEASTACSVDAAKGTPTVEAYTSSMTKISTASLQISGGLLKGDFGSGFAYPRGNAKTTVILKFNFPDGTYEYHKRAVYSNPVAKNTIAGIYGRSELVLNQRAKVFEVLAKGSYGNASETMAPGGDSSYGGLFYYTNSFGNEKSKKVHVGNNNFASMYSPYSTVMDAWRSGTTLGVVGDVDPNIYVDSLTDATLTTDKQPGYYGLFAYKKAGSRDIIVKTAHPAVYYLDISTNDNYGITNVGDQYSIDLMVGNLFFNWDDNNLNHENITGANVLVAKTARNGITLDTSNAATQLGLESETKYDLYLKGTAVAGETISAEVQVRHGEVNDNYTALAGVNTTIQIIVTDKTAGRNAYNLALENMKPRRELCYTATSWKAARNAMLNMECWINDNTDTSAPDELVSNLEAAVAGLTKTTVRANHVFVNTDNAIETCVDPSTETYVCEYCDYSYETHNNPALGHDYEEEVVAPGCTDEGYTKMVCTRCGDEYVVEGSSVPANGHTEIVLRHKDAVCEEDGYDIYKCTVCGAERTVAIPRLNHNYVAEVTREPSCTQKGIRTYTCSNNPDHQYTEDIPMVDHTIVVDPATQATCKTPGLTEGSHCSVCGKVIVAQRRVIGTHSYTSYTSNNDATCAVDGTKTAVCDYGCGSSITVTDVGSKLNVEHTPGAPVREGGTPATCIDAGSYSNAVYCTVCGKELSRETVAEAATGIHTWRYESTDATCTTAGSIKKICTVCGAEETEEGATKPHNPYVSKEAKEPTCDEGGWTVEKKCFICGNVIEGFESEDLEALGHDYQKVVAKEPTCSAEGNIEYYKCSRCGKLFTMELDDEENEVYTEVSADDVVVAKKPHTAETVVDEIPATCLDDGQTALILCSVCGETLQEIETIAAPGSHDEYVSDEAVAVTCLTDGKTAEISCRRCNQVVTPSEVIPATGHKARKVEAIAATCTETGLTEGSVCWNENCPIKNLDKIEYDGEEYDATMVIGDVIYGVLVPQIETDALGHKWDNGKITTTETCTTEGEKTFTCSVCNATDTETVPTIDHDFTVLVSDEVPATCTEPGATAVYKCSMCGIATTGGDEIPSAGHSFEAYTLEPTCVDAGYNAQKCSVCGFEKDIEEIGSLGHSTATFIINQVAPTCTEAGSYDEVTVCNRCGETISTNHVVVDPSEHTPKEIGRLDEIAATCTEGGSYTAVLECEVCGAALENEDVVTDPLGHDFDPSIEGNVSTITAATCTTDGEITVKCSRCDETENQVVEAAGHTPGAMVKEDIVVEDCRAGGTCNNVIRCTVCNEIISSVPGTVAPKNHTAGDAVHENEVDPTCTVKGSYDSVKYCTVCGHEVSRKTISVRALGHDYDETIEGNVTVTAPTCTEPGSKAVKCSRCDEVKTTAINPSGHTPLEPDRENENPATCSATGSYDEVTYCSTCGQEISRYSRIINKIDHTPGEPVIENEIVMTCTSDGSYDTVVKCSVCGDEISREHTVIPAAHHDDDEDGFCDDCGQDMSVLDCTHENVVRQGEVPATCQSSGYTGDLVCTNCGKVFEYGHTIARGEHTIVIDEAVAPTCVSTGLTAGSHCSVCGTVFDAQRPVPKTEHVQVTIPGTPATCTTPGTSDAVVCATCGLVITPHKVINQTTSHVDNDGDGKCDNCHQNMSDVCDCLCHKTSGISKFFYKIVLFFWKLFGIGKSCDCGRVHY